MSCFKGSYGAINGANIAINTKRDTSIIPRIVRGLFLINAIVNLKSSDSKYSLTTLIKLITDYPYLILGSKNAYAISTMRLAIEYIRAIKRTDPITAMKPMYKQACEEYLPKPGHANIVSVNNNPVENINDFKVSPQDVAYSVWTAELPMPLRVLPSNTLYPSTTLYPKG